MSNLLAASITSDRVDEPRHSLLANSGRTTYRWRVWAEQAELGMSPCFATEQRFLCNTTHCPWWRECQDLRAEWGR